MLPRKTLTKKQKKEKSRKKLGLVLVFVGLVIIALLLFYSAFFQKEPMFVSPLAKDQTSSSAKVEKILREKKILYKSLETSRDLTYIIKLDGDSVVIIDPKKNISEQITSLQLIVSQLKIEGKAFKRLDFRYQKPIISF